MISCRPVKGAVDDSNGTRLFATASRVPRSQLYSPRIAEGRRRKCISTPRTHVSTPQKTDDEDTRARMPKRPKAITEAQKKPGRSDRLSSIGPPKSRIVPRLTPRIAVASTITAPNSQPQPNHLFKSSALVMCGRDSRTRASHSQSGNQIRYCTRRTPKVLCFPVGALPHGGEIHRISGASFAQHILRSRVADLRASVP